MNAIVGFTKIALKHMDESSVVASSLSKIDVAGKHLLSLINDVLDMSQIESGKLLLDNHPIEIQQSLGTILPIIEQSAGEKHLDFIYSISDIRHSVIVCDHLRVNQLLLNLLSNAVKYTGAGGKVSLSIDELESDDAEKAVYRFVVKDTGIGMSREFLAHIFEDFTREYNSTTSGTEGTGLGMSIVKKIVDLMNGTIDVQSEPNVGTTVTCVLSFGIANLDEISESRMHAHEPSDMDFSGKRVLLTDDNGLNREIAKDMLEDMKIEVEEAEDGTAAVEKVSEKPAGYYDCVLMDVQMPVMDGYEATRRIRALADRNKAGVPIIALTANAFGQDKINAIDAGMNAHLAKPIDPEAFLTVLSDLLNRKETVI